MLLRRYSALWAAAGLFLFVTASGCESMQRYNRVDGPPDHSVFSVQDPYEGELFESNRYFDSNPSFDYRK